MLPPEPMDRKTLIDALQDTAHEIRCANRTCLVAVYDAIAQASWIDNCDVDLQGLRLVLRITSRSARPTDASERWLARVERIARGA